MGRDHEIATPPFTVSQSTTRNRGTSARVDPAVYVRDRRFRDCWGMDKASYSIIIVNHRREAAQRIIRIANELQQEVASVDSKEKFIELYSPDVKCIVLELSMPNACGIDVIRYLGEQNCRAALILTTNISSALLAMAWKLATGMGLTVVDMYLKPFDPQRLRRALITAIESG